MDIHIEQLTKIIQKNFIQLSTELDLKDLINELYEQSLICILDYDNLLSKTRVERNYYFFMNIDMYGERVGKKFLSWLKITNNTLYCKLINTQTLDKAEFGDYEGAKNDQECIRKQSVILMKRMNANAIAPQLFEYGYFNRNDLESIFILPTRTEKARRLLTLLTTKLTTNQIKLGVLSTFTKVLGIYQPDLCNEFMSKSFCNVENNLQ